MSSLACNDSPRASVLRDLLATFEMNYHLLLRLAPALRRGEACSFLLDGPDGQRPVRLVPREQGPWMTLADVVEAGGEASPWLPPLLVRVRLYHDARVAEVVEMQHRRLQARYPYPNAAMHLPDEKLQTNRLFGEWLQHCLRFGRAGGPLPALPAVGDG
jgi:uncharacterized protein YqiB (DUF1249 family)